MRPDPADRAAVASFVRSHARAIVATTTADGLPQAALVGIAALDDGTLVFDTAVSARKVENLRGNARVAVVVGVDGDVSVQLEGRAVVTSGAERERLGAEYEAQLPGSRALDPRFAVVVIRPEWVRVYDASVAPPHVADARWRPSPADGAVRG